MKKYRSEQIINQLEKRKGGYFYLKIDSEIINQFANKRRTRFLCTLENNLTFQCGLNHLGDGNFFIILSGKNLETVKKDAGSKIQFQLIEDPNPLGVDVPEVLQAILEQDDTVKASFENLTPGKKRNIIFQINKIKDVDKQVQKTLKLIAESNKPRPKRIL